jgi:uncharacterized protein (TIGR03435 family)
MQTRRSEWTARLAWSDAGSEAARQRGAQRWLFPVATVVAAGAICHVVAAYGQVQATGAPAGPAFEVVSVKPAGPVAIQGRPSPVRPFRYTGGRLTACHTLKTIIKEAYSVEDWTVVGPDWINQLAYEISATMPPDTSKETAHLMLRAMLAERFGLKVHSEKRDIPVYVLVEGKKGFHAPESPDQDAHFSKMNDGQFLANGTLDEIAIYCRNYAAGTPVVNMTAIEGVHRMELHWTPDDEWSGGWRYSAGFWRALEDAGLKRESRKVSRDVIVVDHAERDPTPN